MRRAQRLDGFEALEAADAVLDVDDEIANRKRGSFRQNIACLLLFPARADEPITENVLLGDDRQIASFNAMLEPQHHEGDG